MLVGDISLVCVAAPCFSLVSSDPSCSIGVEFAPSSASVVGGSMCTSLLIESAVEAMGGAPSGEASEEKEDDVDEEAAEKESSSDKEAGRDKLSAASRSRSRISPRVMGSV